MHISISKVNFTSISINIAKVDFGRYDSGGEPQLNGMYITPAGDSAISVTPNNSYYTLHGKYLKYSLNGKKWNDWNGGVTIEPEQKMYLKGEDDYVWNSSTSGKLIESNGYYNVGGDISSLTNFITEVKEYTFYKLFDSDSYIKDASGLILPATTLANSCYTQMFYGCNSLTTVPALPATTLTPHCYYHMFYDCTALTTAPELPATTLADYCYDSMFAGCSSLTAAPELPSTTLTESCYSNMFNGCTALTTAPALPATTLTPYCYRYMFGHCASLTTAPALPATVLANYCYSYMFVNCTALTTAPALPATTLADYCYAYMFYGCTALTTAPALPATTLAESCYSNMFDGCSKLNSITMLATDISATGCMKDWVYGVASNGTFTKAASMTSLPIGRNGIPSGWNVVDYGAAADYSSEYMTLSALGDGEIKITIPADVNSTYASYLSYSKDKSTWNETIIDNTDQTIAIPVSAGEDVYLRGEAKQWAVYNISLNISSDCNIIASGNTMSLLYGDNFKDKTVFPVGSQYTFNRLFNNNKNLINAENLILPATELANYCYLRMFYGCSALTTAPALPATTLVDHCYYEMFRNCHALATVPALPATNLAQSCYSKMFMNCRTLTLVPELPVTVLAVDCYAYMFSGCSSLTTAPELPATTLVESCYASMFVNCTSLNSITMLATDISANNCLNTWVRGVPSNGTFTKAASMTTLPEGDNGIPSGWTVVDK